MEKGATLFLELTSIQWTMEMADTSDFAYGFVEIHKHRKINLTSTHGVHNTDSAPPLTACQGVSIEWAEVYQQHEDCWVPRHMVHTNTRWWMDCHCSLHLIHMSSRTSPHQATMDTMSPHHTLLPYIVIMHFMLIKSFQESLPIVRPPPRIKNSIMNLYEI